MVREADGNRSSTAPRNQVELMHPGTNHSGTNHLIHGRPLLYGRETGSCKRGRKTNRAYSTSITCPVGRVCYRKSRQIFETGFGVTQG
jgi:hypothetical protein